MRSLRARFFLISWPLVVAAIAAVAFGVERWTVVELERIEAGPRPVRDFSRDSMWANSVARQWPVSESQLTELASTSTDKTDLVLLDTLGDVVAKTDSLLTMVAAPPAQAGIARFRRRVISNSGLQSEELLALGGIDVRDASSRAVGALYVIPVPARTAVAPASVDRRAALRRRIWTVALAASVASAAAALLLAGPIVRRIRRLADAAASIRSGVLDVRVMDNGADELATLSRSFNAMAASLESAKQQQRNLVSDVAHELRTPLTNVVGLVEAMQDGLRSPDEQTLATLRGEVGLLAALVHELQELSLAESGQLSFDITSVDAVAIAKEAIAAINTQAGQAEIRLTVSQPQLFVRADERRLGQVLRNLLRNAVTHTPVDGRVVMTIEPRGDVVTIVVSDTGRGIPAEHVQLVFERFHRVDPSRDRASGGMGLGLAVVRQLVTAMNGRVWVESELGQGSRFGVELPASATAGAA